MLESSDIHSLSAPKERQKLALQLRHILCLIVSFALIACEPIYHNKFYEYHKAAVPHLWGQIGARLLGKDTIVDRFNLTRGAPYKFLIWISLDKFSPSANKSCVAKIDAVSLVDPATKDTIFSKTAISQSFESYKNEHNAYFHFEGLNLAYNDYYADIKFKFEGNCGDGIDSRVQEARLQFARDYKEEHLSSWEMFTRF